MKGSIILMIVDAAFALLVAVLTAALAPEQLEFALWLIGLLQPVIIAIIVKLFNIEELDRKIKLEQLRLQSKGKCCE